MALAIRATGLRAEESHFFQASLTPDIAIYPKTTEINGLSLNIWGENPQQGVALGFVNGSTGDSAGFSWGLFNYSDPTPVFRGVGQLSTKPALSAGRAVLFSGPAWSMSRKASSLVFSQPDCQLRQGISRPSAGLCQLHGKSSRRANWAGQHRGSTIRGSMIFPDKLATGFPIVNWSF